ncbi:MAG: M55 family metallopeptidase [Clostridia bacterium]|nr:M55 family metallopeptidase [Clostridia bacterium]
MRVFISADIEGCAFTTAWEDTQKGQPEYPAAVKQMTAEVKAACEGAIAAGADYILIKDAHGTSRNIDLSQLPKCCEVIRGGNSSPITMVEGVDSTFDAVMFVGYHSAAGRNGNPLSHTYTKSTTSIKLNGEPCSEFVLYSYACAMMGVPTVFLSGDKMLTEDVAGMHPCLKTVAVKDGLGGYTRCKQPDYACDLIREGAEAALRQDFKCALCAIPEHFVYEVSFKEHARAVRASYYPGFELTDEHTVRMETDNLMDILRSIAFVL